MRMRIRMRSWIWSRSQSRTQSQSRSPSQSLTRSRTRSRSRYVSVDVSVAVDGAGNKVEAAFLMRRLNEIISKSISISPAIRVIEICICMGRANRASTKKSYSKKTAKKRRKTEKKGSKLCSAKLQNGVGQRDQLSAASWNFDCGLMAKVYIACLPHANFLPHISAGTGQAAPTICSVLRAVVIDMQIDRIQQNVPGKMKCHS